MNGVTTSGRSARNDTFIRTPWFPPSERVNDFASSPLIDCQHGSFNGTGMNPGPFHRPLQILPQQPELPLPRAARGWIAGSLFASAFGLVTPPLALAQVSHGFLLGAVNPRPEPPLQLLENARPAGHAAVALLDAEQTHLKVEERLIVAANLLQQRPVVGPQGVVDHALPGELLPGDLLVDSAAGCRRIRASR